jgi:hypothetical protein
LKEVERLAGRPGTVGIVVIGQPVGIDPAQASWTMARTGADRHLRRSRAVLLAAHLLTLFRRVEPRVLR